MLNIVKRNFNNAAIKLPEINTTPILRFIATETQGIYTIKILPNLPENLSDSLCYVIIKINNIQYDIRNLISPYSFEYELKSDTANISLEGYYKYNHYIIPFPTMTAILNFYPICSNYLVCSNNLLCNEAEE